MGKRAAFDPEPRLQFSQGFFIRFSLTGALLVRPPASPRVRPLPLEEHPSVCRDSVDAAKICNAGPFLEEEEEERSMDLS